MEAVVVAGALVVAYLLGTVPTADIVMAQRGGGLDLRSVGDRNPGAWNALEQRGARVAAPIFAGDGLKGALATALGLLAGDGAFLAGAATLLAVMVGHSFPAWAPRRGGRSVMAYVGGALVLTPLAGIAAIATMLVLRAVRRGKLPATVAIASYPGWITLVDGPGVELAVMIALLLALGLRAWQAERAVAAARGQRAAGP